MSFNRVFLVSIATMATALAAEGQLPVRPQTEDASRPTFTSRSELVVLHVMVKDGRGGYVSGLDKNAFQISEEGRPQEISFFTSQDEPVSVGLLLDASGSMQASRELVLASGVAFVKTSNPLDEVFVLGFNEYVHNPLPPEAPFTRDLITLRLAMLRATPARGKSAVYDAIDAGLDYVARGAYERRVLVLVSDGGDNASETTEDEILARTQASNVLMYAVGLIDPAGNDADPGFLKRITRSTGGEAFFPSDSKKVTNALEGIARDIRNTYTIGFVADRAQSKSLLRRVQVRARSSTGRQLNVRTRSAYLTGVGEQG